MFLPGLGKEKIVLKENIFSRVQEITVYVSALRKGVQLGGGCYLLVRWNLSRVWGASKLLMVESKACTTHPQSPPYFRTGFSDQEVHLYVDA